MEHCADDIHYFEHEYPQGEKGLQARLQNVVDSDFARITYTEAVALLQNEIKEKRVKFEKYPNWGDDLGSEHERYITEKVIASIIFFSESFFFIFRIEDLQKAHNRDQLSEGHQSLLHEAQ